MARTDLTNNPVSAGGPAQPGTIADACVVVPMHNEAQVIGPVVRGLRAHFRSVVCVDDGSRDDSAAQAHAAGAVVLRHAVNLGQGAALQTGITYAVTRTDAAYVVTFDADGQHDPADALRMVQVARTSGADVVLGSRFLPGATTNVPGARRLLLRVATSFTRATSGLAVSDTHNGLRVLGVESAAALRIRNRGMAHASELLEQIAALRCRVQEVPVTITYTEYSRSKGQSGFNAVNVLFDLFLQRLYVAR